MVLFHFILVLSGLNCGVVLWPLYMSAWYLLG